MITSYSNTISVTTTALLDAYPGAAAAYSLRGLSSTYTGDAIRVRRASDNTEQDIGFVNNELDTATLESFCSGTDGFVTTWYDQSGNGYDATQTTAANQPQIVSSGSVITENAKPAIDFINTASNVLTSTYTDTIDYHSVFINVSYDDISQTNGTFTLLKSSFTKGDFAIRDNAYFTRLFNESDMDVVSISETTNQQLISCFWDGNAPANSGILPVDGTLSIYQDSSLFSDSAIDSNYTRTSNGINIGWDIVSSATYLDGKLQEIIFYNTNQSSNRTGIETNINTYYSIY